MVVLQLLVALVVLPTSDGTKSHGIMRCAFKQWHKLCEHVIVAHDDNEDAIRDLRERKYKDDKERLQGINRAITDLLKLNPANKSELLAPLLEILDREVSALFKLRSSCNAGTSVVLTIYCEDALYFTALATYELALATMEIAEGSKLAKIKKAEEKFKKEFYNETSNEAPSGLAHTLGTEVRNILEQQN